ncbi:MAG: trigger factor [Planctomycetota bacterium]
MEASSNYTYTLERCPENIKKITIQFSKDYLEILYNDEASKIKNNVIIRGFRPGKVPESLFKRIFYKEIVKTKILEMLTGIVEEIINKEKIKPFNRELMYYRKEDIEKIVENNYALCVEIPSLPDFSQINFNEIVLEDIPIEHPADEFINNFIEMEKILGAKMEPKDTGISQENDILVISFNLYENIGDTTLLNTAPTSSKDNVWIYLTKNQLQYFSKTYINDYTLELNDLLGLENGTYKKIICTRMKEDILEKAYLEVWVKKIYRPQESNDSLEKIMQLWEVDNEDSLKTKITNFIKEINEYERKLKLFGKLVKFIGEKFSFDLNYPIDIEKILAENYREYYFSSAVASHAARSGIEKHPGEIDINSPEYKLFKLEYLMLQYFSDKEAVKATDEDLLKLFWLIVKAPPSMHKKAQILANDRLVNELAYQFLHFKIMDKILSQVKIKEKDSVVILSP